MYPLCQMMIRGSLFLKSAVAEKPLSQQVTTGDVEGGGCGLSDVVRPLAKLVFFFFFFFVNLKFDFKGKVRHLR